MKNCLKNSLKNFRALRCGACFLAAWALGGCAAPVPRSDGDPLGGVFKDAARALVVGRAYDRALRAAQNGDAAALQTSVARLKSSGVPEASRAGRQVLLAAARVALYEALNYETRAQTAPASAPDNRDFWRKMAAKSYRRALEIAPDFPNDVDFASTAGETSSRSLRASALAFELNALGYFLAERGESQADFVQAERLTRRAYKLLSDDLARREKANPKDAELPRLRFELAYSAHDSWAWSLYRLGRFEQALREQTRAVAAAKTNLYAASATGESALADLHYHLGAIYRAMGETAKARSEWQETLRLQADHEEAAAALQKLEAVKPGVVL